MPSFRVTISIGALRPGVSANAVLPFAAAAAAEISTVEASDIAVIRGEARITVRFSADDGELAKQVGEYVVASTVALAEPLRWKITESIRGRWYGIS